MKKQKRTDNLRTNLRLRAIEIGDTASSPSELKKVNGGFSTVIENFGCSGHHTI